MPTSHLRRRFGLTRNAAIAASAALCVVASFAVAGSKGTGATVNIVFNGSTSYFFGNTGTVRASANALEYIGCSLTQYAPPTSNSNQVYCTAKDSAGTTASCTRTLAYDSNLLAAMSPNTGIDVGFDLASGVCTHIVFSDYSSSPITAP